MIALTLKFLLLEVEEDRKELRIEKGPVMRVITIIKIRDQLEDLLSDLLIFRVNIHSKAEIVHLHKPQTKFHR